MANIIKPYMMNPAAWTWRGKTGFFWSAFAFLTFLWSYFHLPETKGRAFEERDITFATGVPTRKFRTYRIDRPLDDSIANPGDSPRLRIGLSIANFCQAPTNREETNNLAKYRIIGGANTVSLHSSSQPLVT
ncbi:hexose carrier protein [Aspergillus bombycis]|uniref:Hexose carrier protein n=1 Tax=Aspergillus bombycis TaxID=109264 RepID=A0A1F8A016_9EURO|nr:hexose carrier protein [Aspergillus bombycis]OGM45062.1 hexose carrier protein [Aspergillus bombycis]